MMYGYIYKTTNLINGKIYIGQHKSSKFDKSYIGSGLLFKRAINKFGFDNFVCIPIDFAYSKNELNDKEIFWINFYNSQDLNIGYNISGGGYKGPQIMSESTKEKLRQQNLGKRHTKISKDKISKASIEHWSNPEIKEKQHQSLLYMYESRPIEKELLRRERISANHKGKIISDETREKLRLSHLGKSPSNKGKPCPDHVKKILSEKNKGKSSWLKGKHLPESYKQNISDSLKGRVWMNNGISRTLVKQTNVQEYINKGYKFGKLLD